MATCGRDSKPACNHARDVWVRCGGRLPGVPSVPVRLAGGRGPLEGRAEFYNTATRTWGSICDRVFIKGGWPSVLCGQLGFGTAEVAVYAKGALAGTGPISFQSPSCSPKTAKTIQTCRQDINPACSHAQDVFVRCTGGRPTTSTSTTGPIVRLVGGPGPYEGRAEFLNPKIGAWGSICDVAFVKQGWPSVTCRDLGFGFATLARLATPAERGTGPIGFMSPMCGPKTTKNMATCGRDSKPTCNHARDVWIRCEGRPATTKPTPVTTPPTTTKKPTTTTTEAATTTKTTPPTTPSGPVETCSEVGGECRDSCEGDFKSAMSLGKDGKCDKTDGKKKCCIPNTKPDKEETCSKISGTCTKGSKCESGFKSAGSQGKEGRCPPKDGQSFKCCLKVDVDEKEETCTKAGGTCKDKDGSRCPSGWKAERKGVCPTEGKKCCVEK